MARSGLTPIRHLDGSPYNGAVNLYHVAAADASVIAVGDAVKSSGSADATGIPGVSRAVAGDLIRGVVVGFQVTTDEAEQFRAASTEGYVLVADAPDIIFTAREDAIGGALAAVDTGLNVDLVTPVATSTAGGSSNMLLDSSSKVATTAQLRLIRLHQTPTNAFGADAVWEVIINEHEFKSVLGV